MAYFFESVIPKETSMAKKSDQDSKSGSTQDAGAPQDETPGGPPEKRNPQSAPGKSARNEKPKPVQRKKKNGKLLSDNADIHDETTI
jgi:hypothetical protein